MAKVHVVRPPAGIGEILGGAQFRPCCRGPKPGSGFGLCAADLDRSWNAPPIAADNLTR